MKTTLGLDVGVNSLGWALINHDDEGEPCGIEVAGARIFTEAVDAKTRTPKNKARRDARQARRLTSRRKMRRGRVASLLTTAGLLPQENKERETVLTDLKSYDPYAIRKRGLDVKLTPFELGRALFHLTQRRGFKSNRKAKADDEGVVKAGIGALRKAMNEAGTRTVGEYLSGQQKKRGYYTDREMFQEEFEKLWAKQAEYHPEILARTLKVSVHNAIFFQRPLRSQKHLVGACTFEPLRKRAQRAALIAQRVRLLQDLNHLEVKNPITREWRALAADERVRLLALLEKQKNVRWGTARKAIELHENETINLEEGKKKELAGNRTAYDLYKRLGKRWDEMTDDERDSLVTDMLTIENDAGLLRRMKEHWRFDDDVAEELAKLELEPGYARLSIRAMKRILPYLEEGERYDLACKNAGYDRSRPVHGASQDVLGEPPNLRNPVVQKALYETRKLLNAVIRRYGKPSVIRIEMARDMKLPKKVREELHKEQNRRAKENDRVRAILSNEFGIQNPISDDVQKYQMWIECKELCPYTGATIGREMLFSPEVDVEHILPYSRTLDDSFMNKTLCMAQENREIKKNRTPFEAYGANQERYLEILARIKNMPYGKRARFERKEIKTDEFVERQLNDTRYIAREVKKYVEQLRGIAAEVTKGGVTHWLRRRWGLNRVLGNEGEKNRADNRHHAVDAIIVALTSRSLFNRISALSAQSGFSLSERGFNLPDPWPGFFNQICANVDKIIVSHAATRKITGALHEETAYGYNEEKEMFMYKKPLDDKFSKSAIEAIADATVKGLVKARLVEFNDDVKKAFGDVNNPLLHKDGKPIKSVRLHVKMKQTTVHPVKDKDGRPYKFFAYGNNHHVEIIENISTGEREGRFVTTMEAARRARMAKTPIVQRDHGTEWRFVMSLHINDMVEVEEDGRKRYYRVQYLDLSSKRIVFRDHLAATLEDKESRLIKSAHLFKGVKVFVDTLGTVTYCKND